MRATCKPSWTQRRPPPRLPRLLQLPRLTQSPLTTTTKSQSLPEPTWTARPYQPIPWSLSHSPRPAAGVQMTTTAPASRRLGRRSSSRSAERHHAQIRPKSTKPLAAEKVTQAAIPRPSTVQPYRSTMSTNQNHPKHRGLPTRLESPVWIAIAPTRVCL